MRQALRGGVKKPVQFVLGGGTYEKLSEWRDILLAEIAKNNPGLTNIDHDYKETKPQLRIEVDLDRAGDMGVTIGNIGRTLETMLGSRRVTTYIEAGEEYDVLLEGERDRQRTAADIVDIQVRSDRTGRLIPLSSLVKVEPYAGSRTLNRYNRVRAITIEANLAPDYTLGEALGHLEGLARKHLPEAAVIEYKGQSREFQEAKGALMFVFLLGIVVVFLVLAAQFESFVHPFVIILTVPLAISGALFGIYVTGGSINLYTQIGLIMLVGLAAKNGILIVEFINQRREEGEEFVRAIVTASGIRLRPILMTAVTTAAASVPLFMSSGAGSETRAAIGIVVFAGILSATLFTVFVIPVAYSLIARRTVSRGATRRRLAAELKRRRPEPSSDAPGAPAE
jgi:multidrug efflux pump